jgi:chromosome segregation ATPase
VHVLTKIFIVLVALLTVAIVPLVAVNVTNEGKFQAKYKDAVAAASQMEAERNNERMVWQSEKQSAEGKLKEAEILVATLREQVSSRASEARKLEVELSGTKATQASIAASLEVLAQSNNANSDLTASLVSEVRALRTNILDAEKRLAGIQTQFDEKESELEVAVAARRALQEEIKRLTETKDDALATIAQYVATVGELPRARAGAVAERVAADRNISATIISLRREDGMALAEINAGSRDGLKAGWVLTIGDGGTFIGNLRVTEVDVNRAVGVVELEDASNRGEVRVGQRAVARAGE